PGPDIGNGTLRGVSVSSPSDAWAVGIEHGNNGQEPVIEHWNGTSWNIVAGDASVLAGGLDDVVAIASDDVWAVGELGHSTSLAEHWDGTSWSVVSTPAPGSISEL